MQAHFKLSSQAQSAPAPNRTARHLSHASHFSLHVSQHPPTSIFERKLGARAPSKLCTPREQGVSHDVRIDREILCRGSNHQSSREHPWARHQLYMMNNLQRTPLNSLADSASHECRYLLMLMLMVTLVMALALVAVSMPAGDGAGVSGARCCCTLPLGAAAGTIMLLLHLQRQQQLL